MAKIIRIQGNSENAPVIECQRRRPGLCAPAPVAGYRSRIFALGNVLIVTRLDRLALRRAIS
jgi:phosphoribosyl 1,2-cyclic phosphodiesterase